MKLVCALTLILGLALISEAQSIKMIGVVYDENGSVVVGVDIVANADKGVGFKTKTKGDGTYSLELDPGSYSIVFEQAGFKKMVFERFRLVNSTYGKFCMDVVLEVSHVVDCGASTSGYR